MLQRTITFEAVSDAVDDLVKEYGLYKVLDALVRSIAKSPLRYPQSWIDAMVKAKETVKGTTNHETT